VRLGGRQGGSYSAYDLDQSEMDALVKLVAGVRETPGKY